MTIEHDIFQSAACDLSTYQYNNTGVIPKSWGLSPKENVLREVTFSIYHKDKADLYITNLPCAKQSQNHSVYKLNTASMTEEIDPTGATLPQPSLEFKFTDESLFNVPTEKIEAFLEQLKDAKVKVRSGFVKCDLSKLRDENGEFKQLLIGDYFKPVTKNQTGTPMYSEFGFFIIEDTKFNYETCEITVTAEHLLFKLLSNVLTYDKDSCMMPQHISLTTSMTSEGIPYRKYKLLDCFNLLDNMFYIPKGGTTPTNPLDTRCNYNYTRNSGKPNQVVEKLNQHLDLNQFVNLCRVGAPQFESYNVRDNKNDLCETTRLAQPIEKGTNFSTTYSLFKSEQTHKIVPLYSYLKNETLDESFREFALLNDLMILPTNVWYTEKAQGESENKLFDNSQATWRLVGGIKPSEHPFPDLNNVVISSEHLGQYYTTTQSIYKISPRCVIEKTNEKEKLSLKKASLVKSTNIPTRESFGVDRETLEVLPDVASSDTKIESFNFNHPEKRNTESSVLGEYGSMKYINGKYTTNKVFDHYTYPSFGSTPLPEGSWYDDSGDFLGIYGIATDLESEGEGLLSYTNDLNQLVPIKGSNELSEVRLIDGRNIISPKVFWHEPRFAYECDKVQLKAVEPIVAYIDENNKLTTEKTNEKHSVEMSHVSTKQHVDCADRILKRVNGENLNPLYKIHWTMTDDPFLRVGTIVYYPLRGKYVKVFITKQTRSYEKNSKLKCEGWVLEETAVLVDTNYSVVNAKIKHKMLFDDDERRRETYYFTWDADKNWDEVPSICDFHFYMKYNNQKYELGSIEGITAHNMSCEMPTLQSAIEKIAPGVMFNDIEFEMSVTVDNKISYISVIKDLTYDWSHADESRVFLGEVKAQPTIVPLMDKHWLLG